MKLLVYESEEMLQHFFKLEAQAAGVECFVAGSFIEFSFYIEDIKPTHLLFDISLIEKEKDFWLSWWSEFAKQDSQIPVVVYGKPENLVDSEFSNIKELSILEKPFVHGKTIDRIKSLGTPSF